MSNTATPAPIHLSAALIVKNEAAKLEACLQSLAGWVDEIVIIDSGSSDATLDIARKYGAKIYSYTDWQGFGMQRQRAQSHVQGAWVMWLDADERVTPELKQSLQAALHQYRDQKNVIFEFNRYSWAFGKFIRHCGWYPDRVLRVYRPEYTGYNHALVHESVIKPQDAKIVNLHGDLLHYTFDSLPHYMAKQTQYASAWAEQKQQQGKKVGYGSALSHAAFTFIKMYLLKRGFLDGKQGLLLSVLSAQFVYVKYMDLWLKQHTPSAQDYETKQNSSK